MKNKKKGFTLVELLVVIAILAILATVTVVGYSSFTEKANKSVDEQLCAQYNTILQGISVTDDDVTMIDLMNAIEENGNNFNDFKSSSKAYNFAYDKDALKVVLIDKKTGEIAFPVGHRKGGKLWSVINTDMYLQPGIECYALTQSISNKNRGFAMDPSIPGAVMGSNYEFDLNHKLLRLDNDIKFNLAVSNGTTIAQNQAIKNKLSRRAGATEQDTEILNKETDSTDNIVVLEASTELKSKGTVNNGVLTVSGKKFFGYTKNDTPLVFKKPEGTPDTIHKIVVDNCEFDGIHLLFGPTLSAGGALQDDYQAYDVEVTNCSFNNNFDSYFFYARSLNSLVFSHNTLENGKRGISVELAKGKMTFEDNTFNLTNIPTITKGERKDNAIQIMVSTYMSGTNTYLTSPLAEGEKYINLVNNKVLKAQAFVTIHDTFGKAANAAGDNYETVMTQFINKLANKDNYNIKDNKLGENIAAVVKDPGAKFNGQTASDYEYLVKQFENIYNNRPVTERPKL